MLNQIGSYKSSEITEHKGAVAAQPGAYVEEMDFARPTGRPLAEPDRRHEVSGNHAQHGESDRSGGAFATGSLCRRDGFRSADGSALADPDRRHDDENQCCLGDSTFASWRSPAQPCLKKRSIQLA
jgi:hypothetical protein